MVKKTKKKVVALALAFATAFTTCPNYGLISRLNASDEEVAVESEISDPSDEEIITTEFIPEEITEISTEDVVSEEITEDTEEITEETTEDDSEDQTEETEEISTEDLDTSSEDNTEAETEEATEENTDEPTEEAEENSEENTEEEEVSYPEWMNNYSDEDFTRIFGIEKAEFDNVAKDVTIAQGQSYSYDGYNSAYYSISGINSKVYRTSSFLLNGGSVLKAVPVKDNSFTKALYFSYGGPGFMNSDLRTTIKEMEIDNIDAVNALSEKALNETFKNIYFPESTSGLQFGVNTVEYGNYASGFNTYLLIDENDGNIKGYYFTPYTEVAIEDILEDDGEEEEKETWFDRYSDEEFFNLFGCFKEEWEEKAADIQVSVGEAYSFDGYSSNYYTVPNGKMYKLGDYNITSDGTYKSVPVTKPEVTKTLYYVYGSEGYKYGVVSTSFYHEEELINKASINAISEKAVANIFNKSYFGNEIYNDSRASFVEEVIYGFPSEPSTAQSYLVVDDNDGNVVGVYATPYVEKEIVGGKSYKTGSTGVLKAAIPEKKNKSLLSYVKNIYNINADDVVVKWKSWNPVLHNSNLGDFIVYRKSNSNVFSQGYCIDHAKAENRTEKSPLVFIEEGSEIIRKVLYYGYRNERSESGKVVKGAIYPYMNDNTESNRQYSIIIMSLTLDSMYNGNYYDECQDFISYIYNSALPSVPSGSLSFTKSDGTPIEGSLTAKIYNDYERGETIQATDWIKVSGSDTLQAKIENLPTNVFVYKLNENGTTTKTDASAVFKNGDMFFLGTPATSEGYKGGYSTKLKYVTEPYKAFQAHNGYNPAKGEDFQRTVNMFVGNSEENGFSATFTNSVGSVEVRKETTRHDLTDYNGEYEYKGAEYAIFNSTTIVGQIIIDETGYGRADNIPVGDYVIQETKAPKGFKLDPNMYPITITANNTFTFSPSQPGTISGKLPEQPAFYGDILIKKIEAKTQNETPLPGAIFVVKYFKGQYSTNPEGTYPMERFWFFESGSDGYVKYDQNHLIQNYNGFISSNLYDGGIPAGTITIQEVKPPVDHKADSTVYVRNLYSSYDGISRDWNIEYQYVTIENESNYMDPADIVIYKVSDDPDVDKRFLKGAEYKVTHYDELFTTYNELTTNGYTPSLNTDSKERVWTLTTDEDGIAKLDIDHKVSGPEFDLDSNNKPAFPMGTLVIEETKAPNGFLLDSKKHVVVWDTAENGYITKTIYVNGVPTEAYVQSEEPNNIPGKIGVYKVGNKRTYDPVTSTLKTEVVELDGIKFDIITNQNVAIPVTGGLLYFRAGSVVETITTGNDGYAETTRKLPMGTYTIREQDSKYWIEADDRTVTLSHKDIRDDLGDDYIVYHVENITNMPIIPEISTTATVNGIHLAKPSSNTVITDKVKLEKLIVGDEYTISGTLMDKNTKKSVVKNGLPVVATKEFTATSENEIQTLEYTFDSTGMEDAAVVVFERLYNSDGELVALHEDINDEGQTVRFPKVETLALGKETTTHVLPASNNVTIEDEISYSNLVSGREYTINGVLMDKKSGKAIKVNNNEVRATKKFTPSSSNGKETVEFTFDASLLTGTEVVVFETLLDTASGIEIASHTDITDAKQTVSFPKVVTKAIDKKTDTDELLAESSVTIVDKISYSNVEVGKTYVIKGVLYDKLTASPILIGGSQVTSSSAPFTANATEGEVSVEFNFDASELKGKTLVVYEYLYMETSSGQIQVAKHDDITDVNQTISIPKISTSARDSVTELRVAPVSDSTTIYDTVSYSNLKVGKKYHVSGKIMDKSSGNPLLINGNEVTASADFTPTSDSGTTEVSFTFDSTSLKGKSIVIFEYLSFDGKTIAIHDDINDGLQTIQFTDLHTTAMDEESQTEYSLADSSVTVVDKAEYVNLLPGIEYTIKGILMDKATGNPLIVDGNEVKAEKTFMPNTANGTVELKFTFDGTKLGNTTLVVYEEIYHTNRLVAFHKDINDEGQTVRIPEVKTTATDSKTGTNIAFAENLTTIKDLVSVKNLVVGKTYKISGILMDKETNSPILVDGNEIRAEKTFVASAVEEAVEVEYIFKSSALKGKTVVVFENLYYKDKLIGQHADINDSFQTIVFPGIKTEAKTSNGLQIAKPDKNLKIIDTVSYSNLLPNKKYELNGLLMIRETGKPLTIGGIPVTAKVNFTPKTPNGTIDVEYVFDANSVEGLSVVVFEDLSLDGNRVAEHKDLNDDYQTVNITRLRTKAVGKDTNTNVIMPKKDLTVVDTIYYKNLIPGKEYKISGKLMNKNTNSPLLVNGMEVVAEKKFTPATKEGTVELEFVFDASALQGETIVVFETLYFNEIEVGAHADITDEEQTLFFPAIKTLAKDSKTQAHTSLAEKEVKIIDQISYENLVSGKEYEIKGTIYDKSTGKALVVNGKNVTSINKFVPSSSNGTVDMEFTFDASQLKGKTVVVFEDLYLDGKLVATHSDITDADQSIDFPSVGTTATEKTSGLHITKPTLVTIVDKVKYTNLQVGTEYTVKGNLKFTDSGEDVLNADKTPVVGSTTFIAKTKDGTVDVEFTFDATLLENKTVVVFENLYYMDKLIGVHNELKDENQSVHITEVRTKASDGNTGSNIMLPSKETVIVDTIIYKNLIPSKEYKVSGVLMNKNTNKPLLVDGKEVTAEKKFTPTTPDGTVELEFRFDGSSLQGETIVVFERLYHENIEVGVHADITDEEQTLFFPAIKTLAKDSKTQTHTSLAEKEVKIIDQITYENLVSGKEYEIKGTIYDKSTGKALVVNDKNVTSSKKFVPDSPNGTVDMEFTFDASQLRGKTVVVFEDLYLDGNLVATHSDITDANQSIEFPNVSTTATEKTSGLHITKPTKVTVVDKVQFTNLNVGTEYTVNGTLRFADSGEVVKHASGIPVVGSTTFIAETKDGTVDVEFTFDATLLENKTVVVFESLYVGEKLIAAHNDLKDENQSVHFPEVKTTARDSETQTNIMFPSKETVIIDKVSYKNLIPNKEYKVSGVLMNKDTNKPLLVDGKEITAEKKFTPSTADGFVELEFKFDGSALQGETVVVFERLYHNNIEVGVHADITDEEQSVKTPLVKTKAVNKETATNEALADGKAVIVDEVSYENVLANKEYTVVGKLYDRITGKPIMENGKEIVAETKFVANSENGTVNVEFTIENASALKGKTLVVFEDLYYNGKIIGTHSDLTDANQTIYFPEVSTTARDKDSEMHIAAPNETITIIDSVEYKNLKIGKKYIMSGVLMDKETNEPFLVDGKEITSEKEFIPETENGIVDIEFTFDGSLIEGQTLVVFEDLIYDNKSVAIHHDINDEGQTVHYSKVRTTAVDEETRLGIAFAGDSIKLIDSVKAENLIPDLEYVIKGIVMDKETGEPLLVNGETIEAQAAFVAKSENETVDVEFTLDGASLKNKTLVIFEEIYCTGRLIGYHKDINDEGQTIHIPEIGTTATSDNGTHVGDIAEEITITDKVSYSNLIPGKTYTVKGVLMDRSTNEPLLVDGKEIRAEKTFIPEEASGYVELEFTFNSSALIGKVVVVFEDLYIEEKQVATHADITDEDQTIYFASIKTLAKDENSGSHMAVPGESVTIVDTISYENLVPDLEYEIRGYMMVKQTGEKLVVNGKEVTATKKFTPTSSSGTVDVSYTFDARELGRKTLVVFEEVYLNGELVAKHKDINDEGQTVRITSCGTKARGKDTDLQTILPSGTKTIIDYVEYHNLIVGYTYKVNGVLMDKATNKPLLDKDGNEITASKEFVAETSDGVVELEFTFDASLLIDKVAVAFESVTYNEKEIAVHADINDEEQTIYFPSIDTVATESTSNTHYGSVGGDVTIVDMVSLKSMQPGTEVVIKGVLMDKATGNPVIIDGKEVRAEKTVNVDSSSLTASMSYTFNTASLNGKTLVCYETVYLNGTVIAVHEDINDADQSVTFSDQPKTGDNTNVLLIVVIAITALAGLVCMIVLKKKKFNSQ